MQLFSRHSGYLTLACAYLVCVVGFILFLPGAPIATTVLAMMCTTVGVTLAYKNSAAYTPLGVVALFVGSLILSLGVIADVHYFTAAFGGTCSEPVLQNVDAISYWSEMNACYVGRNIMCTRFFFVYINAGLMHVFGHSIVVPIMANMFCMQCALALSALITHKVTSDKQASAIAVFAASSICFYMSMGTVLLKDAWVIMSIALAAYALLRDDRLTVGLFAVAAIVMMSAKPSYLLALALGAIVMMFSTKRYVTAIALAAFCVVLSVLVVMVFNMPDITTGYLANSASDYKEYFIDGHQQHQAYFNILGDFFDYPLYVRILMLPVTIVVQFLIPFPWNFSRDLVFGYSQVYAHFAYPWYLFGGVVLYYLIFKCRKMPRQMMWLTLWAVACWLVPCVLHGGTVSRYGLPSVTLMAPCVAAVLTTCLRKRSFVWWMSGFAAALAIVLPICYHLQKSATI